MSLKAVCIPELLRTHLRTQERFETTKRVTEQESLHHFSSNSIQNNYVILYVFSLTKEHSDPESSKVLKE